jgi:hypothetical protein
VVGLAVGTLAVSGMSAASVDAKPGDALYGMKRSAERAQLALSSSQVGRGQLYLGFAKTRIDEVVTGRGDLLAILDDMDTETREGVRLLTTTAVDQHDPAALDAVDTFVSDQRHTIADMIDGLTADARTRTVTSLKLLDDVRKRVAGLRATLSCDDVASSEVDELGPVPSGCAPRSPSSENADKSPTNGVAPLDGTTVVPAANVGVTPSTPAGGAASVATQPSAPASPTSAPEDGHRSDDSLVGRIGRLLGGN